MSLAKKGRLGRALMKWRRPNYPLGVYLGDNLALTQTVYGHTMYVDTRDISVAPHVMRMGRYETETTHAMLDLVKPGMHVVEIGVNVGYYGVIFCDLVGATGRYTGFEANPRMSDIAIKNLSVNGFYYLKQNEIHELAIFDKAGYAEFMVPQTLLGGASLLDTSDAVRESGDDVATIKVKTARLDDVIPQGTRVDVLKVDAEGAEPQILTGAERVLTENNEIKLVIEYEPSILGRTYAHPTEFLDLIDGLGFKPNRIGKHGRLTPLSKSDAATIVQATDLLLMR